MELSEWVRRDQLPLVLPGVVKRDWMKFRCDVVEAVIGELDERLHDPDIPLSLSMRKRMQYVVRTIAEMTIYRGSQLKAKSERDRIPWWSGRKPR